jgi:hypothetical protein
MTRTWFCPRLCGWHRTIDSLADRHIQHPAWGYVTGEQAAKMDIMFHSCSSYLSALARLRHCQIISARVRNV